MFNRQDLHSPFLMHKELGFGRVSWSGRPRVSYPTLPYLAINRRSRLELLAEEMRVLYVGPHPSARQNDSGRHGQGSAATVSGAGPRPMQGRRSCCWQITCWPGAAAIWTGWDRR